MVNFTKRSKEFGLTYADAYGSTKDLVFDYLKNMEVATLKADMVLLAEEVGHSTGKRHYHGYVHFPRKVTVDESTFDCFGMHCHIDNVKRTSNKKSILPMVKYLTKEDQHPLSTFDWRRIVQEGSSNECNSRGEPDWTGYLEKGFYQDQVMDQLINDGFASKLANRYFNWSGFIKAKFPSRPKDEYVPNEDFTWNLPEELTMWKYQFKGWMDLYKTGYWTRPKSLILIGPSRSGKTEWARSLGKHMYFNNLLNLDDWNEDADYIILDDFSSDILKYLPSWKCFFGGQKQFVLTDKYRGKKTVHWGKPMIWLSNEDLFKNLNIEHLEFIKKNCECIVLNKNLY